MSEENSIQQHAQKGFQAVRDAAESLTGAAQDQARKGTGAVQDAGENIAAGAASQAGGAFARQLLDGVQQQAQQQLQVAGQLALVWARAYNQILTSSANTYLDAVARSWEYNRSVLDVTGRAVEDAVELQRRLTSETSRTVQGAVDSAEEQYGRPQ